MDPRRVMVGSRNAWTVAGIAVLALALVGGTVVGSELFAGTSDEIDVEPVATGEPTTEEPSPGSTTPTPTPTASPTDDGTEDPTEAVTEEATEAATEEEPPEPDHDVAAVQARLQELRYYRGAIDGTAGPSTTSAVMAFQKVNGLSADGVIGPNTLAALDDPVPPQLRSGPATRIEVDLTRQVAYLVKGGELTRIMPVSSGSGNTYTTASGGTARSLTPVGWFQIERRIEGVRNAPLGVLYDPLYFYRGWALHGSNSVPAHPASHGCVRLTRADARWLAGQVPDGTAVHLYGGTHTFTAGSSAPGTDTPAGDTGSTPEPTPTETSTPEPTPTETSTPEPTPSPSPAPSTSSPEPTPTGSESSSPEPTTSESTETPSETASGG